MITDEELNKIIEAHGYFHSTTPHYPGCYLVHSECSIRWLVAVVRELSPVSAKRLGTKGVTEETREKELLELLEIFLELLRITNSAAAESYLRASDLLGEAKGLPPEDVVYRPEKPKKSYQKQIKKPDIKQIENDSGD